jgi:FkbM family methyltransferase
MSAENRAKLQIHHIGGRNGVQPFSLNLGFADDYVLSLYDGDSSCEPSMVGNDGIERRAIIQTFAENPGPMNFHINYDPYTSSIHQKNPKFDSMYAAMNCDYVNGDVRYPVKVVEVQATTLDAHAAGLPEPIDFLGLDVEGAEMDILRSGGRTLERDVLGVLSEVMFYEFLEGQKTFGDMAAFLNARGYQFIWMKPHETEYAFSRRPIGWRGRGVKATGDALFLRDPKVVQATHPDPDLGLAKLAFMALNFEMLDYALDALDLIDDLSVLSKRAGGFGRFLHQLYHEYKHAPALMPLMFSEEVTAAESASRFTGEALPLGNDVERLRAIILSKHSKQDFQTALLTLMRKDETTAETLVRGVGFSALADTMRERREAQIGRLMARLGIISERDGNFVFDPAELILAMDQHCKP